MSSRHHSCTVSSSLNVELVENLPLAYPAAHLCGLSQDSQPTLLRRRALMTNGSCPRFALAVAPRQRLRRFLAGGLRRVVFKPPNIPRRLNSEGGIQYRLYFLDGLGHIEKSHEFEAQDDERAVQISEAWQEGWPRMELWQGARIVKRWPGGRPLEGA